MATLFAGPVLEGALETLQPHHAGPVLDLPLESLPDAYSGPVLDEPLASLPYVFSGPVIEGELESIDIFSPTTPVRLLRLDPAKANYVELGESEVAQISRIQRTLVGDAALWDDDLVTTIGVGGGASQQRIKIGGVAQTAVLNDNFLLSSSKISRVGEITVGPAGASSSLVLGGLGVQKSLNDLLNLTPDPELLKASVVGLLNELRTRPTLATEKQLLNGTGGLLAAGTAVYMFDEEEIAEGSAVSDGDPAQFLGLLQVDTADTAQGPVATTGRRTAKFAAGEGVGPHANEIVYLSVTAGFCTLVPPSSAGNVVLELGYVADDSGYSDSLGGTMAVQLVRGSKRVLP